MGQDENPVSVQTRTAAAGDRASGIQAVFERKDGTLMAYTAFEDMRRINEACYGKDLGPFQPPVNPGKHSDDLKTAALRCLRDRCEGLRHSADLESAGAYTGASLSAGQIPFNMQMDIDRLCLEKTLGDFIDSGVAEDAYSVYFCFISMFFGKYGRSKKMVELLSEYESNGSSLLMKHRDHYSHSVYVFALGLAIYDANTAFREAFKAFYRLDSDREAANLFLEYWGLTSLFHDIGYPFELPFEQVLSYFEVNHEKRGKNSLYLAYHDVEALTRLDEAAKDHFECMYGRQFDTVSRLLAFDITQKLGSEYGFTEEYMQSTIDRKPVSPDQFGYFMDHAFFSAARLYRELRAAYGAENITAFHVDALSAILLHNSLFKFAISFYKSKEKHKAPLCVDRHPLAYLLMICDELQCWDRTAYGRNSRTELHPMDADFIFSGGAISITYFYDNAEQEKIVAFHRLYAAWEAGGEQGDAPRLKAYSDMAEKEQRFTTDIEKIVDTGIMPLSVTPKTEKVDHSKKHTYLSNSNFLHFYDFAVALHGRNLPPEATVEDMEAKFVSHSLEYQLSTMNRAKYFARYLDAIHCFYTDKPVDYPMVTRFTPRQAAVFAPMEHERWVREHIAMGWRFGTDYETIQLDTAPEEKEKARRALREQTRCHKLVMDGDPSEEEILDHFRSLSEDDQGKDWKPFNKMLQLLKKFDGTRIYRFTRPKKAKR